MRTPESSRLRMCVALAQLEQTGEAFAALAFALDQQPLTEDEKRLRDYCARLSMALGDCLEELRSLSARAEGEGIEI